MLKREAGTVDLAGFSLAAQLPDKFGACARPEAPSGWPLESNPPDGLVTMRPP